MIAEFLSFSTATPAPIFRINFSFVAIFALTNAPNPTGISDSPPVLSSIVLSDSMAADASLMIDMMDDSFCAN